jgi:mannose-1-phosphate guanylyltransferase/mannose-6-phosphate isomerase
VNFQNQHALGGYFEIAGLDSAAKDELSASLVMRSSSSGRIVPVVLSGGGGSRLWPFSTNETPKQFLPLVGAKSLFHLALDRVRDRLRFSAPIVVGSLRHADLSAGELLSEGDDARLILEPCARNTAPAIAMAAAVAREMYGENTLILVMPSDHVIEDVPSFHEAVAAGEPAARAGRLVTFGIRPSGPDTGYGYLEMGDGVAGAPGVKEVRRFVEKPRLDIAEQMVASGEYLWNAGIFLFSADKLLDEMIHLAPAITRAALQAVEQGKRDGIRITVDEAALAECPSESIDYAVMEHSSLVAVVPMSPGWSDLGSWDALAALIGGETPNGPVTALDCDSCYIRSDGVQVAALGVRDLIIVASGQRLLILPRGRSQEVKKLLSMMDSMAA